MTVPIWLSTFLALALALSFRCASSCHVFDDLLNVDNFAPCSNERPVRVALVLTAFFSLIYIRWLRVIRTLLQHNTAPTCLTKQHFRRFSHLTRPETV